MIELTMGVRSSFHDFFLFPKNPYEIVFQGPCAYYLRAGKSRLTILTTKIMKRDTARNSQGSRCLLSYSRRRKPMVKTIAHQYHQLSSKRNPTRLKILKILCRKKDIKVEPSFSRVWRQILGRISIGFLVVRLVG